MTHPQTHLLSLWICFLLTSAISTAVSLGIPRRNCGGLSLCLNLIYYSIYTRCVCVCMRVLMHICTWCIHEGFSLSTWITEIIQSIKVVWQRLCSLSHLTNPFIYDLLRSPVRNLGGPEFWSSCSTFQEFGIQECPTMQGFCTALGVGVVCMPATLLPEPHPKPLD